MVRSAQAAQKEALLKRNRPSTPSREGPMELHVDTGLKARDEAVRRRRMPG